MKKKIVYKSAQKEISDAIISSRIIDDFLPAPEQLIKKEDNKYITFSTSKNKNVTFNTSKYHCTEVDSENREEFCNNLSKLVSEYRKISSALNDKQNEILNVFK